MATVEAALAAEGETIRCCPNVGCTLTGPHTHESGVAAQGMAAEDKP